MRRFVAAALLLLAGCDPCSALARVHMERCNDGDGASCTWLVDNGVDPFGRCAVRQ